MKKKITRFFCGFVATVILFTLVISNRALASEYDINRSTEERFEATEALLDLRAEMLTKLLFVESVSVRLQILAAIEQIDSEIESFGNRFIDQEELIDFLASTDNTDQVVVPQSAYNDWTIGEYQYYVNGRYYYVTRLAATPDPSYLAYSNLAYDTTQAGYYNASWVAGSTNIVRADSFDGENTLQSVQGTIYNAVRETVPEVTTSTLVRMSQISYRLSGTLTASFLYVRDNTSSSTFEELKLVSTRAHSTVNYVTSAVSYKDLNGAWVSSGVGVSGVKYYNAAHTYYDSAYRAINLYIGCYPTEYHDISRLRVFDPANAAKITEYLCVPSVPLDVES